MLTTRARKRRAASYIGAGVVPASGAPDNTVAPAITGTARVGQVLTGSTGTWSGTPTFARQWRANGAAIPGATGATYTLVTDDLGKVITLAVTATEDGKSWTVVSAPTAAVLAAA
jgi:hypothetical protein